MDVDKNFVRAWYTWIRTSCPTNNFRRGSRNSPTYSVECDLDHVVSRVNSLGHGVIEKTNWNYPELASIEITELDQIMSSVEKQVMPDEEKRKLMKYISATRELLELIGSLPTSEGDLGTNGGE